MDTKILAVTVLCLASFLAASAELAPQPKPDFSGTWEFVPERSSLQITPPDATTIVIEHSEPLWRFTRTHVFGDESETLTFELTTDGKPTTQTIQGWDVRSRIRWEGETLVFESTMSLEGQAAKVVVRYRLEDDGRTLTGEHHTEGEQETHDNLWVFEKSD